MADEEEHEKQHRSLEQLGLHRVGRVADAERASRGGLTADTRDLASSRVAGPLVWSAGGSYTAPTTRAPNSDAPNSKQKARPLLGRTATRWRS